MPEVHVSPSPEALAEAAAERVTAALAEAIAARGRASLVLTGGSTPEPLYHRLAQHPDALDWSRVYVFWGDERCVPPDDEQSNYHLAHTSLLEKLPIPDAQIHRMDCDREDPAAAYSEALRTYFDGGETLFDVTLLGLGEDGHVGSLFPGSEAVDQPTGWVMQTEAPPTSPVRERMTLTLPGLNSTRLALFLVTGKRKREALRAALEPSGDPDPAARVRPVGTLEWYVDEAAYALMASAEQDD